MLDAVQRRFAGQRRRAFTGGRRRLAAAIGEELARRIVAQGVVIVDVFIAQGDARDPLGQESGKGVDRVLVGSRRSLKQSAMRSNRRIRRACSRSNRTPASDVISPPSKAANTTRLPEIRKAHPENALFY